MDCETHQHARSDALQNREMRAMIKDIVVNVSIEDGGYAADYAISLATVFRAHVTGIAFTNDMALPMITMDGISPELIETSRREMDRAAKAALERFADTASIGDVSAQTLAPNVSFSGAPDHFARIARCFDLVIVGQADPDKITADNVIVEAALLGSGRPIIIVPYIQKYGLKLDHVAICWDGSRAAARATADAMPFLVRAKNVEIVIVVNEPGERDEIHGTDISEHLARHAVATKINHIVAGDLDVATSILSHLADSSADIVVMGGYGHSRLREFMLGGVTRSILKSMTVPVLMSH
jgi:nucleotide-binding universal stress UspA family protein